MVKKRSNVRSAEWERGHMMGLSEGYAQSHRELLDLLEKEYMDPANDPQSDRSRAVIQVASMLGDHLRTKIRG